LIRAHDAVDDLEQSGEQSGERPAVIEEQPAAWRRRARDWFRRPGRARVVRFPLSGTRHCHASTCPVRACVAAREVAAAAAHHRAISRTRLRWQAPDPEVAGIAASLNAQPWRAGRSRASITVEPSRVVRSFTKDEQSSALALLQKRPVRRGIERDELVGEAWLELVNPRADVAARETAHAFHELVEKAVQRAYAHVRPRE
jgi:hypothetical protein